MHCYQGVSRSCSFVLAHDLWRSAAEGGGGGGGDGGEPLRYSAALEQLRAKRAIASPNQGFTAQLLEWSQQVGRIYGMDVLDGQLGLRLGERLWELHGAALRAHAANQAGEGAASLDGAE